MSTFLLFLFLNSYAIGQVSSSEVVNASIPKGAKRILKDDLSNYLKNNYKHSQVPVEKADIFKLNEIIIGFWDLSVNPDFKKSLKDSQSEIYDT